ncbi:MAG: hypothetical protein Q4A58_04720 [Fusobacterium sp.]|uniref:hypothetical protein n=1 Tax=Fusobacterium sp. TaxID=68766 RepID=UPI0026DB784C|nr:hypothetical protein [Fusobacterium sp.]MDO4690579.1 hypothetical protein [Fusobacterium sp.]
MKKFLIFLLLFLIFSFSISTTDIKNIIEIQVISNKNIKTYYTIFSLSKNSFIFYDEI